MTLPTAGEVLRPAYVDNAIADFLGDPALGEWVGFSTETTDSSNFTTTPTQIGSVTFAEVTGCSYIVECLAHLVSTGTDIYQATLYEDSTAGTERHAARCDSRTSDQARPNILPLRYLYVAGSTGSKTFVVTGHRVSGGGNVRREADTTHPQLFTVTLVDRP